MDSEERRRMALHINPNAGPQGFIGEQNTKTDNAPTGAPDQNTANQFADLLKNADQETTQAKQSPVFGNPFSPSPSAKQNHTSDIGSDNQNAGQMVSPFATPSPSNTQMPANAKPEDGRQAGTSGKPALDADPQSDILNTSSQPSTPGASAPSTANANADSSSGTLAGKLNKVFNLKST